jgi:hypothetical protein
MATTHPAVAAGANPSQVTELLWQDAVTKLGTTNNELLLPVDVKDVIGITGVGILAERLGYALTSFL